MLSAVRLRWVIPILLLALLIAIGRAESQQPLRPQGQASDVRDTLTEQHPVEQEPLVPVFRTGINFIRVDAIVTDDDDNPVTDLTVDDFEIIEDGVPQTVESFQFIEISDVPAPNPGPVRRIFNEYDEGTQASRPDIRLFVISLTTITCRKVMEFALECAWPSSSRTIYCQPTWWVSCTLSRRCSTFD